MTALQQYRLRLRRAARGASQVAEALEFLGFDFLAQLARVVFFVALLTLALIELVVRVGLQLSVVTGRFLRVRLSQLLRALLDTNLLLVLVACLIASILGSDKNISAERYSMHRGLTNQYK